jgi:hypothetical protein
MKCTRHQESPYSRGLGGCIPTPDCVAQHCGWELEPTEPTDNNSSRGIEVFWDDDLSTTDLWGCYAQNNL